jgi:glyoxylase-like metal-dependent hydrolase (beta-lactamase superfamily II)
MSEARGLPVEWGWTVEPRLVAPGVYMLVFEIGQAYLWDWGDGVTVIDTGTAGSAATIVQGIRAIGRRPEDVQEILLTHFHDDHRGGAAELVQYTTRAKVTAHRADAAVVRGQQPQPPPVLTDAERPLAEAIIPMVPQAPPVEVGHEVEDGDETAGGGVIVSVPGHTPGSIAVLVPRLQLLFTGDTIASVNGNPILGPFNIDRAQAIESVRKQAGLEFDIACFGHGDPLIGGADQRIRALAAKF